MLPMNYFRYYENYKEISVICKLQLALSRQRIVLVNAVHGKTAYSLYVFGLCTSQINVDSWLSTTFIMRAHGRKILIKKYPTFFPSFNSIKYNELPETWFVMPILRK